MESGPGSLLHLLCLLCLLYPLSSISSVSSIPSPLSPLLPLYIPSISSISPYLPSHSPADRMPTCILKVMPATIHSGRAVSSQIWNAWDQYGDTRDWGDKEEGRHGQER